MQKENVLRKRNEKGARSKKVDGEEKNVENKEEGGGEEEEDDDENEDVDMYEDEWDSEGLDGDDESRVKERNEDEGNVE